MWWPLTPSETTPGVMLCANRAGDLQPVDCCLPCCAYAAYLSCRECALQCAKPGKSRYGGWTVIPLSTSVKWSNGKAISNMVGSRAIARVARTWLLSGLPFGTPWSNLKLKKIRNHAIEGPGVTKVAWTVSFFDIKSFSGPANECSQSLIP